MIIHYYPDTDSLYMDLSENSSSETMEISPGVMVDLDEEKNIVGIDIERASTKLNLSEMQIIGLPVTDLSMINEQDISL